MPVFDSEVNQIPFDGHLYWIRQFYPPDDADRLFTKFISDLSWQQEDIFIYGKWLKVPRLMCWYGDHGATYRYSGVTHQPLLWTSELLAVKRAIEQCCEFTFNSVLANLYRNGSDSMGCHADDEKELGHYPVIASLSLGETRLFKLHHKKRNTTLNFELGHGDLVVMAGAMQEHWVHSVPKTKRFKSARINLTFRKILMG